MRLPRSFRALRGMYIRPWSREWRMGYRYSRKMTPSKKQEALMRRSIELAIADGRIRKTKLTP